MVHSSLSTRHRTAGYIYNIWILVGVSPDKQYKKKYILPGAIIPEPNKPKNPESFMYPSLHHLAALQNEGLCIWDASANHIFTSHPFLLLAEANVVGAPELMEYVGHHGKHACRNGCRRAGQRKPGGSHYYAVSLKPDEYAEEGCDDNDYEPSDLPLMSSAEYEQAVHYVQCSQTQRAYESRRLGTGIVKPSIFLGLSPHHRLAIPGLFPSEIMHLFSLNIPDLIVKLWHGTMECDTKNGDSKVLWNWVCLTGDVWKTHGEEVASACHFLPGSFDRPPWNPVEKISSGYKCVEFLNYVYWMGLGMLYGILPTPYWKKFCMLVAGARIIYKK